MNDAAAVVIPALAAAVASLIGAVALWVKTQIDINRERATRCEAEEKAKNAEEALSQEREALRLPRPPAEATRRCSVLLLGIGGTGKSALIHSLFGAKDVVPNTNTDTDSNDLPSTPDLQGTGVNAEKTMRVRTWDDRLPYNHSAVSLSVTDYVGQNLGTLVRFFAIAQKQPFSPLAYGWINAVVFVVDVLDPSETDRCNASGRGKGKLDLSRVKENIAAWNWQSIAAIWGMLTKHRFRKIVIIVKKTDLLSPFADAERKQIREQYQPLFEAIKMVFPNKEPVYICGPLGGRLETDQLKQALWDAADDVQPAQK